MNGPPSNIIRIELLKASFCLPAFVLDTYGRPNANERHFFVRRQSDFALSRALMDVDGKDDSSDYRTNESTSLIKLKSIEQVGCF